MKYKTRKIKLLSIVLLILPILIGLITPDLITPVTAYTDLVIDGETVVISTTEIFQSVTVKNGGNLTITSSGSEIWSGLTVQDNSYFQFNMIELDGAVLITDSTVMGLLHRYSYISTFTATNSIILLNKYTDVYVDCPNINGIRSVNSTIIVNDIELDGDVSIIDSTVRATLHRYGDITIFNVSNSDVVISKSVDAYIDCPCIYVETIIVDSIITLNNIELDGTVWITNSTVIGILHRYSSITEFSTIDSEVTINKSVDAYTSVPYIYGETTIINSTVVVNNIEIDGSILMTNSVMIGTLYRYSSITELNITESDVIIRKHIDIYTSVPIIYKMTSVKSTVDIEEMDLYGPIKIDNSIISLNKLKLDSDIIMIGTNAQFQELQFYDTNDINLTSSNLVINESTIDCNVNLVASNLTVIDSKIYIAEHEFHMDTGSNITNSGSIGYIDIWRDTNSTDLLVTSILFLPENHVVTIEYKDDSDWYPYEWIEVYPDLKKSAVWRENIYYANFTIPKSFYDSFGVDLILYIKHNDIVVWQSQEWCLDIEEMIPDLDVVFPDSDRWEGTIKLEWTITSGEIDLPVFNIYLYEYETTWHGTQNITNQLIIAEGIESSEYYFDTTEIPDGDYIIEISIGDFNSTTRDITIDNINDPPSLSIVNPIESWGYPQEYMDSILIEWLMFDPNGDSITADIHYSFDQTVWYTIAEDITSPYLWDMSYLPDGECFLRIIVSDGLLETRQIVKFKVYNPKLPVIQITSPQADQTFIGTCQIEWKASDPNPSDILTYAIYYSTDNSSWTLLVSNYYITLWYWNITTTETGVYYILVTAFDGTEGSKAFIGPIYIESSEITDTKDPLITGGEIETTTTESITTPETTTSEKKASGFLFISVVIASIIIFTLRRKK